MKTVLVALWAVAVVAGLSFLVRYRWTPGQVGGGVPRTWPEDSTLFKDPLRSTLVMAVDSRCPCSRASLHELADLMEQSHGRLVADVSVSGDSAIPGTAQASGLWKEAGAIPGVHVTSDVEGREARRFAATISGQVAVYDRTGTLIYDGGITAGRGHEGPSAGLAIVLSALNTQHAHYATAPVYGCRLPEVGMLAQKRLR